jgi:hypothetical protein
MGVRQPWQGGTRFRLFPQYDEGFEPEVVEVSSPAGSLGPGPSDARMYVANAVVKSDPYTPPYPAPPYPGAVFPPAWPDAAGHFDGIPADSPQFHAAHLFGTVRLVLDIWEARFGEVPWWHPDAPPRLELIPFVYWQNAQSGPGFLETGWWPGYEGEGPQPFCLNFDVVAHETGHALLFGTMGAPPPERIHEQFLGYHESFADTIALLSSIHFASARARLLQETHGNLYIHNVLNRLAATGPHQQIRMAANKVTMAEVADLRLAPDGSWIDPTGLGRNAHALADPLTGAVFDLLVAIFEDGLVRRGLISGAKIPGDGSPDTVAAAIATIYDEHADAYAEFAAAFDESLLDSRDVVFDCVVHAARSLTPETVSFDAISARILEVLAASGLEQLWDEALDCFLRRGIDPRPWLRLLPTRGRSVTRRGRSGRELAWSFERPACCCSDLAHVRLARRLMPHAHRSGAYQLAAT